MTVDRSMAPATEFGVETIGGAMMTPPVMFVLKPVGRAIMMPLEGFVLEARPGTLEITPRKLCRATAPEVASVDRIIRSIKAGPAVRVAITASFTLSP